MTHAPTETAEVLLILTNAGGYRAGQRAQGFVLPNGDAIAVFNGTRSTLPAGTFRLVTLAITKTEAKPDARAEEYQEAPPE